MKNLITILGLLFFAAISNAKSDSYSDQTDFLESEKRLHEFCTTAIGYQPGFPDLLNAIEILGIQAKISACSLYKQMGLKNNHSLYMLGFRKVSDGNEFTYNLVEFLEGKKPISQICVAKSRITYHEDESRKEIFTINCRPDSAQD